MITLADAARAANADIAAEEELKQKQAHGSPEQPAASATASATADAAPSTVDAVAAAPEQTTTPTIPAAAVAADSKTAERKTVPKKSDKKDAKKADKRPKKKKFTPDDEVVTLSNLNIKAVLANKNADIFVQFHKPECDLCRHLRPEFRKTANAFKDVSVHPTLPVCLFLPCLITTCDIPTLQMIPIECVQEMHIGQLYAYCACNMCNICNIRCNSIVYFRTEA